MPREQMVISKSGKSSYLPVNQGVPQGSVLGPTLFLIYINDLENIIKDGNLILFADDTTYFSTNKNANLLKCHLTEMKSNLSTWFTSNSLLLNESKTVTSCFTLKNLTCDIENQESVNFLGIRLDPQLTWHSHIDYVTSKTAKNIFLLKSLRDIISDKILLNVYFAYIHARLTYGILVWGHSPASDRLFKLQRRAVRVIANLDYQADCRKSFQKFKILTLPSCYILSCLLFVKTHLGSYTTRGESHMLNLRGNQNLNVNFHRLQRSRSSVSYWGPKLFNKLPAQIQSLDLTVFKKKVKSYLLCKNFYSLEEFLNTSYLL